MVKTTFYEDYCTSFSADDASSVWESSVSAASETALSNCIPALTSGHDSGYYANCRMLDEAACVADSNCKISTTMDWACGSGLPDSYTQTFDFSVEKTTRNA